MGKESGVPKNLLEVCYKVNQGISGAVPNILQSWVEDNDTPKIIGEIINLSPLVARKMVDVFISKGFPAKTIAYIKARMILNYKGYDMDNFNALMPSKATGFVLRNTTLADIYSGFKDLGVKVQGQWQMAMGIKNKPGPTYFTNELAVIQLIGSRYMIYEEQEEYAKKHKGRIATLEEILNFFLDLAIRGKLMKYNHPLYEVAEKFRPLALREDEERGYLVFFVRTSNSCYDDECSPDDRKKYYSVWFTLNLNDLSRSSITISERPGEESRENMGVMIAPL